MTKKNFPIHLSDYPEVIRPFLERTRAFDSSSHSGATVLYLENGYYLKIDSSGKLANEAKIGSWFEKQGLGVPVIHYVSEDKDYLLTKAATGKDTTYFLHSPSSICKVMAAALKQLHSLTPTDFPNYHHLATYRKTAHENYQKGLFYEEALLPRFGITGCEEAYQIIKNKGHLLTSNAFIHGDACLPNIIMTVEGTFSAFIDLGLAGFSDKHIDLFWTIWSLQYNLGDPQYSDLFLDYYGRENVDEEKLKLVAAFEVFG